MRRYLCFAFVAATFSAGCANSKLTPPVEVFADAVEEQAKATIDFLEAKAAEDTQAQKRRNAIVTAEAYYDTSDCKPKFASALPLDFEESEVLLEFRCPAALVVGNEEGGLVPLSEARQLDLSKEDAELLSELDGDRKALINGRRLSNALKNYAAQLRAVATSTDQTKLKEAFVLANGNVLSAAEAIRETGGTPIDPAKLALIKEGQSVLGSFFGEALEVSRFNAVKQIVNDSDEVVEKSARALVIAVDHFERPDDLFTAYENANQDLEFFYAGDTTPDALRAQIEKVETARTALVDADRNRNAFNILKIAETHRSLKTALNTATAADFAAASQRVLELTETTDALVKKIEANGDQS